jgi:hypothetical protein
MHKNTLTFCQSVLYLTKKKKLFIIYKEFEGPKGLFYKYSKI